LAARKIGVRRSRKVQKERREEGFVAAGKRWERSVYPVDTILPGGPKSLEGYIAKLWAAEVRRRLSKGKSGAVKVKRTESGVCSDKKREKKVLTD
jgi:hypothetical protein